MPPGRKKAKQTPEVVEVVVKEPLSSDEEDDMFVPIKRKSSSNASKKITKTLNDTKDSDLEENSDESDKDRRRRTPRKQSAPVAKSTKSTTNEKISLIKGKKTDTDEDESNYSDEEDSEEDTKRKGNAKGGKRAAPAKAKLAVPVKGKRGAPAKGKRAATAGVIRGKGKRSDESNGEEEGGDDEYQYDTLNLEKIDDGESSNNVWEKPDYEDKVWFKKNCLLCQVCKKTYKTTGDALICFNNHKKHIRCFACFFLIPNGQDATKRLFKHYIKRHEQGDKNATLKCPYCKDDQSISFRSVSCHIIDKHFEEVLDKSEKHAAANSKKENTGKKGKKKLDDIDEEADGSSGGSEDEEQDEGEEEGEETEEDGEDDEEDDEEDE